MGSQAELKMSREPEAGWRAWRDRIELRPVSWAILVYLASRVLLLAVAVTASRLTHTSLLSELGRWDGTWEVKIASTGYPHRIAHAPSTLGFFPLLPLLIWLLVHAPGPPNSTVVAGVLISTVGGLIATLLILQLTTEWWGPRAGRRATALFCVFPGSIVFSMVYGEGLLVPLAAGCILALERRRWLLAGALAGAGTAVQPDAIVLIAVCAVVAGLEFHERGWRDPATRRSLVAPLLSGLGIGGFAVYLWAWTGTPLASLKAQHYGWGERINPAALLDQGQALWRNISTGHWMHDLGPLAAVVGTGVLAVGLVLLLRRPRTISAPALAWTLGIAVVAVLSQNVPPNPRILITAFPAVLVLARSCSGWRLGCLIGTSTLLLILTSALTYGGHTLTP